MRENKVVSDVLGKEHVLSPSDVLNYEFSRSLVGGYSASQVDWFLARVADVLENLIQQIRDLKAQLAGQREELDEHRQMEETLRNALVTSQKFGENLIESAKREASLLIEAARLEKSRIDTENARLPILLAQEITHLQDQRDRLRADIRAILAAHEALLEDGGKPAPPPAIAVFDTPPAQHQE
ncbi:MAG: DivIVA domain-containing protein [Candidatus Hydrogenedentes bacterium]|nr:DivIVA domain-containing protein [Candidatus Hydrogenedentota bacterium]